MRGFKIEGERCPEIEELGGAPREVATAGGRPEFEAGSDWGGASVAVRVAQVR